jgi:hypothetical protein
MFSPSPLNRRQSTRYQLTRLAKLEPTDGGPRGDCLVTDISDESVQVFGYGAKIPEEFTLLLGGNGRGRNGKYQVVWRVGSDVGAKRVPDA